ncbi:MAG: Ternary complex associated domain 9 [Acidobacteriota bacterium]|jgi:hypothetical protein|nr:Ternary complex associated domain 9 [Acidobacteriota bacterium]
MIYDGSPRSYLGKALQTVARELNLKSDFRLIVDTGRLEDLSLALAQLRSEIEADSRIRLGVSQRIGHQSADLVSLFDHFGRTASSFHILDWPPSIDQVLDLSAASLAKTTGNATAARKAAVAVSRLWTLRSGEADAHGKATENLWEHHLSFKQPQREGPLPFTIVIIDDDRQFCRLASAKLSCLTVPTAIETHRSVNDYEQAVCENRCSPPEAVDLFLIDIVDADRALAGLENTLPKLRKARGLERFPQLFILSDIPSERIADLCYRSGADYFLEKQLFLAHPNPANLFGALLWHTLDGPDRLLPLLDTETDFNVKALQQSFQNLDWNGWEEMFPASDVGPKQSDRAAQILNLTWELFSREMQHNLSRLDLVERFGKGRSGATTFSVLAWMHGSPTSPRVLKIDDAEKMAREWTAFHEHVSLVATDAFARIEHAYRRRGDLAAIAYTLAGSKEDTATGRIVTCLDLFRTASPLLGKLANLIFDAMLAPIHDVQRGQGRATYKDVLGYFAEELAPTVLDTVPNFRAGAFFNESEQQYKVTKLKRVPSDRGDHVVVSCRPLENGKVLFPTYSLTLDYDAADWWHLHPGREFKAKRVAGSLFVEPYGLVRRTIAEAVLKEAKDLTPVSKVVAAVRNRFSQSLNPKNTGLAQFNLVTWVRKAQSYFETLSPALHLHWAIAHADLNLQNVLCCEAIERFWLIDYAGTRPAPPAVDYALFEMEIRLQVLVPIMARWMGMACDSTNGQRWFNRARATIRTFEELTQNSARVRTNLIQDRLNDHGSTKALDLDGEPDLHTFRAGWQVLLDTRRNAFRLFYRDRTQRKFYDWVLMLTALRVVQKYKAELTAPIGPVGSIWAAIACEVAFATDAKWNPTPRTPGRRGAR